MDESNGGKIGIFSEAYISVAVQKCQYSLWNKWLKKD